MASSGLRVNSSLHPGGAKVPFAPSRGRQVTWYICGPTVYDSAHVGHARTYLAFDIIRRILEDYFGYHVFYVMNVTDVDDKIIARARGDYLLDQYIKHTTDPAQAVADVLKALEDSVASLTAKVLELKKAQEAAPTQKLREDMDEQVGQEELKLEQRQAAHRAVRDALGPAAQCLAAPPPSSGPGPGAPNAPPGDGGTAPGDAPAAGAVSGVALLLERSPAAAEARARAAGAAGPAQPESSNGENGAGGANDAQTGQGGAVGDEGARGAGAAGEWEAAVDQAREALASALFKTKGESIADLSIFRKHAARYEAEFLADMKALGVRPPHVLTRVTEYMDKIVEYVDKIIKRGFGYASNGSVYFDTQAFIKAGHAYGKLCPWAVDNTERAAEGEANFASADKKSKADFALWKKSKPGEPSWDSPWGPGRPGWHIECSAMASDVIGEVMDIHSGGIDLRFPHHSNELAQAEAYYDSHEWVRYFLHAGHLHIEGRKMSKSLKNFITIREALEKHSARHIRMLFLMQAWDKNMNFGEAALEDAAKRDRQLKLFFQTVQSECRGSAPGAEGAAEEAAEEWWGPQEKELSAAIAKAEDEVRAALEDNFDTASALLALLGLTSAVNVYVSAVKAERGKQSKNVVRPLLLERARDFVASILGVFGLKEGPAADAQEGGDTQSRSEVVGPFVRGFAAFRDAVRSAAISNATKEELLALTDRVRDTDMVDLGIRCEDRPGEATALAELDDPAVLKRERDERKRQAAEEAVKKLKSKLAARVKEVQKWEAARVPASELLRSATDKYSAWDAKGIPTHDASGKELSGKARKGAEKEHLKQTEANSKLEARLKEDPLFLEQLKGEVVQLEEAIGRARA